MKIVYLDSTKPDLAWYRLYYESIFPEGARQAAIRYLRAIEGLTDNPRLGRLIADNGTRRYAIRKTPLAIVYRLTGDQIEIIRIWDQRADPRRLELHEEAAPFS